MKRFGQRCGSGARHGRVDFAKDLLPALIVLCANHFLLDSALAVEKKLGQIGQEPGVANGNAVGGDKLKELADDVLDVGGGLEVAGERGEFLSLRRTVRLTFWGRARVLQVPTRRKIELPNH